MSFDFATDDDGTHHVRDDYHAGRCTVETDDARVSGVRSSIWNIDLWGNPDAGNWALVQWGVPRLENDGGAWEGTGFGVGSRPGRGDIIVNWYTGTGDYEGLSYFELWTGSDPWKIQGQIFPGDPPPPYAEDGTPIVRPEAGGPVADDAVAVVTGTATCPTADLGSATTDADGVQHFRNGTYKCTMRTDDPRVSGTETAPWNMDVWGTADPEFSGANVQWGSSRLENDGGAWEGFGTGVASKPGPGDSIAIWYKGTGDYTGLSYFELWTGSDPWKIQGQIFPGDSPTP